MPSSVVGWSFLAVLVGASAVPIRDTAANIDVIIQCYRHFQELGKKVYAGYIGSSMILYDEDGSEVSCNKWEQQKLRSKYNRRCIFSPIHCMFSRRLKAAIQRATDASELDAVKLPFLYVHHRRHSLLFYAFRDDTLSYRNPLCDKWRIVMADNLIVLRNVCVACNRRFQPPT
ncbi:unnamed protein product [Caenorhabditis auriculariae]|uniref:Secreted protein n=1 Tax=Caenorhabditis auriculariae TaxID=2777116 RepID=A0A8S1HRN2_9PELO|nr:unnamed protein product [Caenorhabditis auriculariae]